MRTRERATFVKAIVSTSTYMTGACDVSSKQFVGNFVNGYFGWVLLNFKVFFTEDFDEVQIV